jgi:AcrR family transcriptional regulator
MTNSPTAGPGTPGKRERLVDSAVRLVHEQGAEKTTLAEIAAAADVPAGNVYYYFKTKDDLLQAAIDAHAAILRGTLAEVAAGHRTPAARLKALVAKISGQGELAALYGCPQGTLCSELDKRDDELSRSAARLMEILIDWARDQFAAMGRRDAGDLAIALIAAYQGISLLTNTLREPKLMRREGRRLERWIDELAASASGSRS